MSLSDKALQPAPKRHVLTTWLLIGAPILLLVLCFAFVAKTYGDRSGSSSPLCATKCAKTFLPDPMGVFVDLSTVFTSRNLLKLVGCRFLSSSWPLNHIRQLRELCSTILLQSRCPTCKTMVRWGLPRVRYFLNIFPR